MVYLLPVYGKHIYGRSGRVTAYTVGVISLGCNKNRVDTETALGLLKDRGYVFTPDPAEADILMVNTCGFIDSAKEESINTILEMAAYKESGRCRLLVVTGCLAQRYEESLLEELPEIDLLLGSTSTPPCRILSKRPWRESGSAAARTIIPTWSTPGC